MQFIFTNAAKKQFQHLSPEVQDLLKSKIQEYKEKPGLFTQGLKSLKNLEPANYRLKVGNYRFLLESEGENYRVLKVGHRKSIYK